MRLIWPVAKIGTWTLIEAYTRVAHELNSRSKSYISDSSLWNTSTTVWLVLLLVTLKQSYLELSTSKFYRPGAKLSVSKSIMLMYKKIGVLPLFLGLFHYFSCCPKFSLCQRELNLLLSHVSNPKNQSHYAHIYVVIQDTSRDTTIWLWHWIFKKIRLSFICIY